MDVARLNAVVGRGGLLPPLASGTYEVNDAMLEELRQARRGEHASNLGAYLAQAIAEKAGVAAYVVDPVSVDEWDDVARLSGSALLERQSLSHALNSKAVAKRYAREQGKAYESLRLIVAHLGSGISVSAHEGGRMVDVSNPREEGAFSPDRAGGVPAMQLVDLCFSGKYSRAQVEGLLFREGGLYSYLGTKDLVEVERRISSGDERARLVFAAMVYQIAKEIGAMATVLSGRVDACAVDGRDGTFRAAGGGVEASEWSGLRRSPFIRARMSCRRWRRGRCECCEEKRRRESLERAARSESPLPKGRVGSGTRLEARERSKDPLKQKTLEWGTRRRNCERYGFALLWMSTVHQVLSAAWHRVSSGHSAHLGLRAMQMARP